MDGVHQPHHDRQAGDERVGVGRARVRAGRRAACRSRLIASRFAIRSGDANRQHVQRPPLPRPGVFDQPGAIGRGGLQRPEVDGDLLGRRDSLGRIVSQHRLQRRNPGVVAGPGHQLRGLRGEGSGQGQQEGEERKGRSAHSVAAEITKSAMAQIHRIGKAQCRRYAGSGKRNGADTRRAQWRRYPIGGGNGADVRSASSRTSVSLRPSRLHTICSFCTFLR